jgi:lipoyl-dependent peroxiredoxin
MNILYTTETVVEGGRAGHGRTSAGRLVVELSVPKEIGVRLDSPAQQEA